MRFYLCLDCKEEDDGRTGEGCASPAPAVPVPRPVARGLADRRQVRMQLIASFTHGALNPLRICAHSVISKKYSLILLIHFLTVMPFIHMHECVGTFTPAVQPRCYGCCKLGALCAQAIVANIVNVTSQQKRNEPIIYKYL